MEEFFNAMLPVFLNAILPVGGTIITGLAGLVAVKAKTWIETKTDNEVVSEAMSRITHTAETVVAELNQTLVPKVLEAASDGKLTSNDARMLKDEAISMVRDRLPDTVHKAASLAGTKLVTLIGAKIEQAVLKAKNERPIVAALESGIDAATVKSGD